MENSWSSFINCKINFILTLSKKCVLSNDAKATTFAITGTNISVVTLSAQDNAKKLQQLKSGLKRTINCNEYKPKVSPEIPNPYLDFVFDPSFQRSK